MKLLKTLAVTATLTLLIINPLYAQTAKLTSTEVGTLATIAAIDTDEIMLSVLATNKKPSSEVEDLAKMMISQHGSNLTQVLQMAYNLKGLPLRGGESEKMAANGKKEIMALGGLEGKQFDVAYVDAMVKGHQGALDLIDKHLMKTAKSEEMKQFMTRTREVVAHHLEAAKKVQENMKS